MVVPLAILAILSVVGGWMGSERFDKFLSPVFRPGVTVAAAEEVAPSTLPAEGAKEEPSERFLAIVSVAVAALGFLLAWFLYHQSPELPDQIAAAFGSLYQAVASKYWIDELYAWIFVKPLIAISGIVFWRGIDCARAFRQRTTYAVGQRALLCWMGGNWGDGGDRLHGLDGDKDAMNGLDPYILTLVTFVPSAGALLLLFFPRRDRDIRLFALIISLLTFILSLHLPAHFHRDQSGFQFDQNVSWIPTPNIHYHMGIDGISLWLVVLTAFLTPLCVLISWKSIHERVKEFFILLLVGARFVLVLLLLGSDPNSDGPVDRNVWARAPGVCGNQIFSVHHDRVNVHAGGDSMALCEYQSAYV